MSHKAKYTCQTLCRIRSFLSLRPLLSISSNCKNVETLINDVWKFHTALGSRAMVLEKVTTSTIPYKIFFSRKVVLLFNKVVEIFSW